jgi:hypothetical protein
VKPIKRSESKVLSGLREKTKKEKKEREDRVSRRKAEKEVVEKRVEEGEEEYIRSIQSRMQVID